MYCKFLTKPCNDRQLQSLEMHWLCQLFPQAEPANFSIENAPCSPPQKCFAKGAHLVRQSREGPFQIGILNVLPGI